MSGCYAVFHKQLGDLLLLEPALNRLQAHHGDPVRVMTRAGHLPLLSLMPCARPQTGPALVWRSNLYCFDPLNKSAARSFFAPARVKRCILPEQREIQWFHRWLFGEIIVPELGDRYVAEYFWENTPVPTSHPFRPPQLLAPPPEWKPPGIGDGPFLLLNPTSGWRQKTWLPDRWAEVIRALAAEGAPRVILTSASTDWQVEHCRAIAEAASPHVQSLSSGTTLEQFLWLCANASMVLTVDGAASHLAAAFGVRSLTLFGPTNIRNWHHPTSRNIALQAASDKDGKARLRNLASMEVLAAARNLRAQAG